MFSVQVQSEGDQHLSPQPLADAGQESIAHVLGGGRVTAEDVSHEVAVFHS